MRDKFKVWLWRRFLPAYCRDGLLEENRRLKEALERERQKNRELRAYIEGARLVLRRIPRQITSGGKEGAA